MVVCCFPCRGNESELVLSGDGCPSVPDHIVECTADICRDMPFLSVSLEGAQASSGLEDDATKHSA